MYQFLGKPEYELQGSNLELSYLKLISKPFYNKLAVNN